MRTPEFNARWNTGDGSPHSEYILKMFRYVGKQTDPGVVQMYVDRLSDIPLKELQPVWESLQPLDSVKPIVPGIEALRKAHASRKKDQLGRMEEAQEKKKRVSHGERFYARKATNAYYANRVVNHLGFAVPVSEPAYFGSFDYKACANTAPLPPVEVTDHTAFWNGLWAIFDEQWAEYAGGTR